MKLIYHPKSELEKFGAKIYNLLVENFPETYYVGGMVRDLLLKRKVTDIDIATKALPKDVMGLLSINNIKVTKLGQKFGTITAIQGGLKIEITSFRSEDYGATRYPKVRFGVSTEQDSNRRDFTINSLYFSPKLDKILDFHKGLKDLAQKQIRFIGDANRRLVEDPLRIVRALRFSLVLDFKFEKKTRKAIENNFPLLKTLTQSRIKAETEKLSDNKKRKTLTLALEEKKRLTKHFF